MDTARRRADLTHGFHPGQEFAAIVAVSQPCDDRGMAIAFVHATAKVARLCISLPLIAATLAAGAQTRVPYALPPEPPTSSAKVSQSILFDIKASNDALLRQQPIYIESITVIGQNPDAAQLPKKSLERRFADALNAPATGGLAQMRPLDTTPCTSLVAMQNNIGSSFVPTSGCPK